LSISHAVARSLLFRAVYNIIHNMHNEIHIIYLTSTCILLKVCASKAVLL